MSSKAKRPNAMDRLVTKRDLLHVVAAFRKVTRLFEERIEVLERATPDVDDGVIIMRENETPT